ncbi:PLP-dependent aminotransferase family protein [Nocardioides sp. Bht2]|uniref:aminotransferase-like domain-containing protein n=1 Tax=Nocardioides sp. Bht2 TaxID=3392297 RepID=UPI0039B5D207
MPTLPLQVDRDDPRPLPTQIAAQVRELALSGRVADGARLPSTRALAADLGVSRGVAEQAWDQLRAEGWLEGRRGSGTWLRVGGFAQRAVESPATRRGVDEELVMMDAGTPWRDPRQSALWRRAWREVSTADPPRAYEEPGGIEELRVALAERLRRTRGLAVEPDQVLVTSGTVGGLRQLFAALSPGEIAIEDPGFRAAVVTAELAGRVVRSLPVGEGAESDLAGCAGAYVTPSHQHPTGRVLPADERLALLRRAEGSGCVVIEDDYDSEFRYDVAPVPALASMAPGRVAYLGTASKTVLPSLRLGWMVLPESLHGAVLAHRAVTFDMPPWPVQKAFATLLRDGHVDAVIRSARKVYAARAEKVVAALSPHAELAGPVAGMYSTWLLEPDRALRAREAMAAAGFRINLLADYCRNADLSGLLVGFGGPTDAEFELALEVLVSALSRS